MKKRRTPITTARFHTRQGKHGVKEFRPPRVTKSGQQERSAEAGSAQGGAEPLGSVLQVKQAAEVLGLRPRDVVAYAQRGELPSRLVGDTYIFTVTDLDVFTRAVPPWNLQDADDPAASEERMDFSAAQPSQSEIAVEKLRQLMIEKAANKPHDSLEPEPAGPTSASERPRTKDGRFAGPRVNVDEVPRLPTFPARWLLADPRGRPYLVYWESRDGYIVTALKMEVGSTPDTVVVTLRSGYIQRLGIRHCPLPRGTGTRLFYLCPKCGKPRRYLCLWARSEAEAVDYFGLRCQRCAGLRFKSQGRYISSFERLLLTESFGPHARPSLILSNVPWDPKAISDPRLLNLAGREAPEGQAEASGSGLPL